MVLKRLVPALAAIALLAAGGVALADDEEYRPSEFLTLDLSQAVLSPKRLGPPAEFAPVALQAQSSGEASGDHASEPYWAREELEVEPKEIAVQDVQMKHPHRVAHEAPRAAAQLKPKGAARTKLAHRHGNPLDAQARDAHIQKWPCRSGGGICGWK
jgi:hypothetical protein